MTRFACPGLSPALRDNGFRGVSCERLLPMPSKDFGPGGLQSTGPYVHKLKMPNGLKAALG